MIVPLSRMRGMYLGVEIGGTKLQMGLGTGDGRLSHLWRASVDVAGGAEGIRVRLAEALPNVLAHAGSQRLQGVGVGFGGPVDDATQTVIKSHQISSWDGFPLSEWLEEQTGAPAVLGNDADLAGLAETLHGAGEGLSPLFYITLGSGIGGGLILDGAIYRGVGRGAAEIGHLAMAIGEHRLPLEEVASGWGLQAQAMARLRSGRPAEVLRQLAAEKPLSAAMVAQAAALGDPLANEVLDQAWKSLAEAICHVIALLCPRRIVIGGGVALMGEKLLFEPLRQRVAERCFAPFAGLTDIVPAKLGEEMVVHGAIALARQRCGGDRP